MKTKFLVCLSVLCMAYGITSAKANHDNPSKKNVNSKPNDVVQAFIDASVHTDAKLFAQVLDDKAYINVCHGTKLVKHKKSALVSFFKKLGPSDLNCKSDYEILSTSGTVVMVRVDFTYPEFVQRNFLTLEKGEGEFWNITQVNRFNEKL